MAAAKVPLSLKGIKKYSNIERMTCLKPLKRIAFFTIFIASSNSTFGQSYLDLVKFQYKSTPINGYEGAPGGSRVNEFTFDATVPVELNEKFALITGFIGESLGSQVEPNDSNITQVYGTTLKFGLNVKYNDRFSMQYVLLPKISSDFIELSSDDFQLGAVVLAKYKKSDFFTWKYGLYYNQELFGPFFVPLLGFYMHRPDSRWEFNLTLPLLAEVNYNLTNNLQTGARFNAFVRTYNLNKAVFTENGEYLQKTSQELQAFLRFFPVKGLIIEGGIGFTVGRRFDIYNDRDKMKWGLSAFNFGDDRPEPENPQLKNGMIFSLRAIYRYDL